MVRKSRGEMGIISICFTKVLGPTEAKGTVGIGGLDDAGSGLEVVGNVDAGMWGLLSRSCM